MLIRPISLPRVGSLLGPRRDSRNLPSSREPKTRRYQEARGNMVKLTFCLRRLPNLSREEFQKYWIETHGPLVRERAAAIGALRYVQLHTGYDDMNAGLQKSRGGPDPYDGVAELWFEDVDAIAAGLSTEAGRRAASELLEDERRFIDLENSPLWIADEHQIVP